MHAPLRTRPAGPAIQARAPRQLRSAATRTPLQAMLDSAPRIVQLRAQSDMLNGRPSRPAPEFPAAGTGGSDAIVQLMPDGGAFRDEIEEIAPSSMLDIFFAKQVYTDNPEFSTIAYLLDRYAELGGSGDVDEDEEGEDEGIRQDRTQVLYEIEHEAYAWYAKHPGGEDSASASGESKSEYHDVIVNLLRETEAERTHLAKRIVRNRDDIWVPGMGEMGKGEQKGVQDLWKGLLGNKGRLKVRRGASEDEKAKIYAHYLQLASGAQGRQLLGRAMAGNAENQSHVITIDPSTGGEPEASPIDSPASHRRFPADHPRFAESVDETQQITLTQKELGETMPGRGSGSVIPFQGSPQLGAYYALGQHEIDDPVKRYELMPSFVVLGHELGHAVRQQHGESTVRFKSPFHDTREGNTWHNREEQTVITGTENRLRGEHGLGARKFHRALPLS
jgi:hypothetical protein